MEDLQKHVRSLDVRLPTDEKLRLLYLIQEAWRNVLSRTDERPTNILRGNIILRVYANVMEEKFPTWKDRWPVDIFMLLYAVSKERDFESELFPLDQIREVVNIFRKYFMAGCHGCMLSFRYLAALTGVRQLLLHDDELYNIMKQKLDGNQLWFFYSISGSEEWQLKLLSDKQLILDMLALNDNDDVWDIFFRIAQNPDAKTLLPKVVIEKVHQSAYSRRTELYTLLCNEDDLKLLKLSNAWVEETAESLKALITKGKKGLRGIDCTLLDIVLPIGNLSTVEAQKQSLGKLFVPLLLDVICGEMPATPYTTPYLVRGKQEAAKALWNFAYLEANRGLIDSTSIERLKATLAKSNDEILRKNISGVLHMLIPHEAPVPKSETRKNGHVMISYNWGNQPIVMRIAKSLQAAGYEVWLDVEQMGGSTLEAMAGAIENAELVLICMSQKYKDSPNCRLECEYCVNRKINYVPLMMQKGYRPDGWLGITLGAKLYYEFTEEENWDGKMTELRKAIGNKGKSGVPQPVLPASDIQPKKIVTEWSDKELQEWMKSENIFQHYELFKRQKLNRRALLELQCTQPQFFPFIVSMFKELGIVEYGEILLVSSAIRNLK